MSKLDKRIEIRDSWKARLIGTVAGWIVRVFSWTIRIEIEDRCGVTRPGSLAQPLIWCTWHSRILGFAMARLRHFPSREGVVLTSASHDGAALAAAARVFRAGAVRGSSSRRGSAAMKELVRSVKDGLDVGITPDGPRGPRYQLHGGVIKLAQVTRAPLLACHVRFSRAWRLQTWDRFVVPWPFSRLTVVLDEVLEVPRSLDDDGFEATRERFEERMRAGVDDLDAEVPVRKRKRKRKR